MWVSRVLNLIINKHKEKDNLPNQMREKETYIFFPSCSFSIFSYVIADDTIE